jgi:hypothetical protein
MSTGGLIFLTEFVLIGKKHCMWTEIVFSIDCNAPSSITMFISPTEALLCFLNHMG